MKMLNITFDSSNYPFIFKYFILLILMLCKLSNNVKINERKKSEFKQSTSKFIILCLVWLNTN